MTFCDRTGEIFEIKADVYESKSGWVPRSASCEVVKEKDGGQPVVVKGGDGSANGGHKPFKTEWYAGSYPLHPRLP